MLVSSDARQTRIRVGESWTENDVVARSFDAPVGGGIRGDIYSQFGLHITRRNPGILFLCKFGCRKSASWDGPRSCFDTIDRCDSIAFLQSLALLEFATLSVFLKVASL